MTIRIDRDDLPEGVEIIEVVCRIQDAWLQTSTTRSRSRRCNMRSIVCGRRP